MSLNLPICGIVADRPAKAVDTPDGGMDVLTFDWETGDFGRDMSNSGTLAHPLDEDVDFGDEGQLERRIHARRVSRSMPSSTSSTTTSAPRRR